MKTNSNRSYGCKDEELPVICGYAAFSMKRDLADFTAYSPKFNEEYVTGYETKIANVKELVSPKSETIELKNITKKLYSTMDSLLRPVNYLEGYIEMDNGTISLSARDFSLKSLRKGINSRDAEKVINDLHTVNTNIEKYKEVLTANGLSETMTATFASAETTIAEYKQQQYQIVSNRKTIVQNNLSTLNDLYDQLSEILKIGKILYKNTDPVKKQEYTFSKLKKKVRHEVADSEGSSDDETNESTPDTEK